MLPGEDGQDESLQGLSDGDFVALVRGDESIQVSFTASSRSMVPTKDRWCKRLTSTISGVSGPGAYILMTLECWFSRYTAILDVVISVFITRYKLGSVSS
jgi:hypothetical protein